MKVKSFLYFPDLEKVIHTIPSHYEQQQVMHAKIKNNIYSN